MHLTNLSFKTRPTVNASFSYDNKGNTVYNTLMC